MTTSKKASEPFVTTDFQFGLLTATLIGVSPLVYNAMSEKVRQELLMPRGRKTTAEKATTLKHNPLEEYRNSVYQRNDDGPTRLTFPASAFKGALASVCTDVPGSSKAQMSRLTWVDGLQTSVYGAPELWMTVVRMADINRTPDIRSRAILPQWCCEIKIRYTQPLLTGQTVGHLLSAAGMLIGVGDGRQQKGAFNFGQFRIASSAEDDQLVQAIKDAGGMQAQDAALANPSCYDMETEKLLAFYEEKIATMDENRRPNLAVVA